MSAGRAPQPHLRIGELADAVGLNPKTIRYYEEIGLLREPERTQAGYRLYRDEDAEMLRFVGQAKAVGFSLDEIRQVLDLRRAGQQPCAHVLALLDQHLAAVDAQLVALRGVRRELASLRDEAADARPTAGACVCGIIEQHAPARPIPSPAQVRQTARRR